MTATSAGAAVLAAIVLSGCATDGHSTSGNLPEVRVLYADSQCGERGAGPAATLLKSADDLLGFFRKQGGLQIGARQEPPLVGFSREHLVLLGMGERPTAGYGLGLAEDRLRVSNHEAELRIRWEEPAPGLVAAQVMTSPCLLVSLPKGPYSRIRVLDQRGVTRWSVSLPQ